MVCFSFRELTYLFFCFQKQHGRCEYAVRHLTPEKKMGYISSYSERVQCAGRKESMKRSRMRSTCFLLNTRVQGVSRGKNMFSSLGKLFCNCSCNCTSSVVVVEVTV